MFFCIYVIVIIMSAEKLTFYVDISRKNIYLYFI